MVVCPPQKPNFSSKSDRVTAGYECRIIGSLVTYYRPGHTRRFIRQRNGHNIGMFSRRQRMQPLTQPVISTLGMVYHRPRSMHQQLPQVTVATFGDAQ